MSKEDNGGPAFACVTERHLQEGMTLRDYFAAKAMQALASGPEYGVNPTQGKDVDWKAATARTAYELADSMLEARKK